ncbi:hypothetical protein BDQ17DRAFT_1358226 [Cyathus striatus]|nr:hypothetical protein BDQ17DRAFT_1358226 [Cyathus striatus]
MTSSTSPALHSQIASRGCISRNISAAISGINEDLDVLLSSEYRLNNGEKVWRSCYSTLLQRGYQLRPRYNPEWRPAWLNSQDTAWMFEDSVEHILPMVLDAKRIHDGRAVCFKLIKNKPHEIKIAQYLFSPALREHPKNHCVPVLDAFHDPTTPGREFLVIPVLRPFNDPEFGVTDEVVDFVTQVLENDLRCSGRDCTGVNIMMDARPIIPNGWHFAADEYGPDGFEPIKPLARMDYPVRYVLIDFGLSHRFSPAGGRDIEVPEIRKKGPKDLFKIDVFTLGNTFCHDLYATPNPAERPTASESIALWKNITKTVTPGSRWRLQKRDETLGQRVVLNTVDVALFDNGDEPTNR